MENDHIETKDSDIFPTLLSRATEMMDQGNHDQAAIFLELLLNTNDIDSNIGITACDHLMNCYSELGMQSKVLRSIIRKMQYTTPDADLCCQIGYQYIIQQNWSSAIYWYDLATHLPSTPAKSGTDANRTWIPHLQQCVCYDKLGDLQRAYEHHKQAEIYVPDHPSIKYNEEYFGSNPEVEKAVATKDCSLSLLVPSVPERQGYLFPLLSELHHQTFGKPVEIVVLIDNKKRTIGDKRNQLLHHAKGQFVAFIDDDDRISPNYVSSLLTAIEQQPHTDCIVFDVQVIMNGVHDKVCKYGVEYQYGHDEQYFYRKPNHLMCYAKRIASRHMFKDISYGEDDEWGGRCASEVEFQHRIDEVLYTYEWVHKSTTWYYPQ